MAYRFNGYGTPYSSAYNERYPRSSADAYTLDDFPTPGPAQNAQGQYRYKNWSDLPMRDKQAITRDAYEWGLANHNWWRDWYKRDLKARLAYWYRYHKGMYIFTWD